MKIFGLEIRRASKEEISNVAATGGWSYTASHLRSREKPMLLPAVYRCVELISDSVAVLPIKIYELDKEGYKKETKSHPFAWLLNNEPNPNMTRYTFMKMLTASVLLRGNGRAYIDRDEKSLEPRQLIPLSDDQVQLVWVTDKNGVKHKMYWVYEFKELVEPMQMLDVLNFSYDGNEGISTLKHAAQTIGIATANEEAALEHFTGGQNMTGVLTVEGARLTDAQKKEIYAKWADHTNHSGGMQILEGNMKYQPISISPKDSQLLDSRAFSVLDICRFFSVSPVKAFDLSKSSYSTVEATQLQYLTDTVLPWITKFEMELNRKLILPSQRNKYVIEFDTSVLLRTDKSALAEYWTKMFSIGATTPNEVRQHSNLSPIEGGDKAFVQVNVQTLEKATDKVSDN